MVSLIIPYIDEPEIILRCLQRVSDYSVTHDLDVILISNGSAAPLDETAITSFRLNVTQLVNEENTGVLASFKQGFEKARGDVICFIHSDVLIQEYGWDSRVEEAFAADQKLGLAGLLGANRVHPNGGRENVVSNMLGLEWGKCDCHKPAAMHHGMLMTGISPAIVFDGVGLFFRKAAAAELSKTDIFDDWRAPHHGYDRIISLKVADLGWHMAVIGIGFDHWSGATANSSDIYNRTAAEWCEKHGVDLAGVNPDQAVYREAMRQFEEEYAARLPAQVDERYRVQWNQ